MKTIDISESVIITDHYIPVDVHTPDTEEDLVDIFTPEQ